MKLLILTQKVDKEDGVLGFIHGWIEAFSKQFEKITVICLEEGVHDLPENVRVFSLGKEKQRSRIQYVSRFYNYIVRECNEYDAVYVHMNQEYVLLGAPLWKLWGKKVGLWYNHGHGTMLTSIACAWSDLVFHTSNEAFTARSSKAIKMPVGIDTEIFSEDSSVYREPRTLLSLGRISPVKRVDVIVNAALALLAKGETVSLAVYGKAPSRDALYAANIEERALHGGGEGVIFFKGSVPNYLSPAVYRQYEIFINLTADGTLDKTIFEGIACGAMPLVSNSSLRAVLPAACFADDISVDSVVEKLRVLLALPEAEKASIRKELSVYVVREHSLSSLAKRLFELYQQSIGIVQNK